MCRIRAYIHPSGQMATSCFKFYYIHGIMLVLETSITFSDVWSGLFKVPLQTYFKAHKNTLLYLVLCLIFYLTWFCHALKTLETHLLSLSLWNSVSRNHIVPTGAVCATLTWAVKVQLASWWLWLEETWERLGPHLHVAKTEISMRFGLLFTNKGSHTSQQMNISENCGKVEIYICM